MKKLILAILFCASTSFGAATRYYLPSSGAPAVSPGFGTWTTTVGATRIGMVGAKSNTAMTDNTISPATGTNLITQFVSAPIGVVNLNSTTVSLVVRAIKTGTMTGNGNLLIRLYHTDTTFTTIFTQANFDASLSNSASTIIVNAGALLNVTSQNNDRIVAELGINATGSPTGTGTLRFGDLSASADFALTSGLTTDLDPWLEFSATIPAATATATGKFFNLFSWLRWNFGRMTKL